MLLLFNQLLHCNDDVSFSRNKRVNETIILHYTFQEEVQFPRKISGPQFICFDINMACIIRTDNHHLLRVHICLCTRSDGNLLTCKISSSLVLWLVSSKEKEESVKITFPVFLTVSCAIDSDRRI